MSAARLKCQWRLISSIFPSIALTSDYPDDWPQIATAVKQAAGYRCDRCGLKCLPPAHSYRHLERSLRRRLSALLGETHAEETSARFHPQVHHIDRNPAHNDKANLVCVCAGCHLRPTVYSGDR